MTGTALGVDDQRPDEDRRPSYAEAIAEGSNLAVPGAVSATGSIRSLSLHDGSMPPSALRLKRVGRQSCQVGEVTGLAMSPQGFVAVSHEKPDSASPSTTKLWDFRTAFGNAGSARIIASEVDDCPAVVFSADGRFNATLERATGQRRIKIRKGEGKMWKSSLPLVGRPAEFSPDGKMFAATDSRGVLLVFEAAPNSSSILPAKKVAGIVNHAEPTHVKFMPSGLDVVTLSRDGTVRISEAKTGKTLRRMEVDGVFTATGMGACALGVSPDGRVVVSVWPRAVYVWEHEAGGMSSWELNKVRNNEGWPLAISPDCRLLACRTEEGMDISDVYSGQVLAEVRTAPGIDGLVTAAAFSADGKVMAVGRYSGVVDVWDTAPFED